MLPAFALNDLPGLINFLLVEAKRQGPLPQKIGIFPQATTMPATQSAPVTPLAFTVSHTEPVFPTVGEYWLDSNPQSSSYATLRLCVAAVPEVCWHLCASVQEAMNPSLLVAESTKYLLGGGGGGGTGANGEIEYTPVFTTGTSSFTLPYLPSGPVSLYINGVIYRENVAFTRSGVNVTWLNPVLIEAGDDVAFRYSPTS